jgi:hypothetical protein
MAIMSGKKLLLAVAVMSLACSGAFATTIFWGNDETTPIQNSSGLDVNASLNWLVVMYKDGGDGIINNDPGDFNSGTQAFGDDTVLLTAASGSWVADGFFFDLPTNAGGLNVYTRVFNVTTLGAIGVGTECAALDPSFHNIPSGDNSIQDNYNTTGALANEWKTVPEPSVVGLLLLGFGLVAGRRFFGRR